jgi:hypothetical protein
MKVLEKRVIRIFGSKRDEVTGGFRGLHNKDFYKLFSSPSMIRMVKSRRMQWARHIARIERGNVCRILVRRPERKRQIKSPGRRWGLILKQILERRNGVVCNCFIWALVETSGGLLRTR